MKTNSLYKKTVFVELKCGTLIHGKIEKINNSFCFLKINSLENIIEFEDIKHIYYVKKVENLTYEIWNKQ